MINGNDDRLHFSVADTAGNLVASRHVSDENLQIIVYKTKNIEYNKIVHLFYSNLRKR